MIYVDANEHSMCTIPAQLIALGVPVEIRTDEPHFDYLVENAEGTSAIGVERKTVSDYFQSKDGGSNHLNNQLCDYTQNLSITFLAVIGDDHYTSLSDYVYKNNVPRRTFMGGYIGNLIKTSENGLKGTVKIVEFVYEEDFVLFLQMLHEKVQEGNFTRAPKFICNKASQDDVAVRVLTGFDRIGEEKARDILTTNGTLENALCKLLVDGTFATKGIGQKIESDIKEILKKPYGGKST